MQRYPAVQEPGSSKINRNNRRGSTPGQGPESLPLRTQFTLGSWWRQRVVCTFWSGICGYRIYCVRAPREDNVILSRPILGWCREGEARPLCTAEAPGKIMSYSHPQPCRGPWWFREGEARPLSTAEAPGGDLPCCSQQPVIGRKYLNACKLYIVRILNVAFYLALGKGMFDSWKEF